MPQYQTFPGAPGDSLTLDKLKALRLPDMEGKSFLDVGCNEGFFCGFAKFQGAARAVGIDHGAGFVERARRHFPDCEFHNQGWEQLPDGDFDVILLASALHYADDQQALLDQLVSRLTCEGVLVLELGIVSSKNSEWVKVKRGIDDRYFPTMPKLREILAPYAWKWMGPSVEQAGDPVGRHVLHISRRRPVAYLLMQPPAYGKSSIAGRLFPAAGVKLVSGDHQIGLVAQGKLDAPAELRDLITAEYSPYSLDQLLQRIFDAGSGPDLVRLWADQGNNEDFALDVYVPHEKRGEVVRLLREEGYVPVVLDWERPGTRLLPASELDRLADEFYLSLALGGDPSTHAVTSPMGFVDQIELLKGELIVRGWAVDGQGNLPRQFSVASGAEKFVVDRFTSQLRPDVQRHLGLRHALVGYRFTLPMKAGGQSRVDVVNLKVMAAREGKPVDGPFQISGKIDAGKADE